MLNFRASKPRVKGGPEPSGPPLDPHLKKGIAGMTAYSGMNSRHQKRRRLGRRIADNDSATQIRL